MGNITNRTSNHQLNLNDTHRLENRLFSTSSVSQNVVNIRKSSSTIKMVLPDPESRQKLRQTYNGEILQAGGTLTGRQIPNIKNLNRRYSSASSTSTSSSSTNQKFPDNNNQNNNGLLLLKSSQTKNLLYKSEPDLRNYNNNNNNDSIISNNKFKKKYKAPAPPLSSNNNYSNQKEENNDLSNQEELPLLRRARLFKTREESKKNSNNSSQYPIIITNNDDDQIIEENSSFIEDKILPNENLLNFSRPKYNSNNIKDVVDDEINLPQKNFNNELLLSEEIEQRSRDEPSGKESSIPELSPSDRKNNSNNNNSNKPNKVFYFGMENNNNNNNNNEDSDLSSNNNNNNNCYNNNTEDDSNNLIEDSSSSIGNINLNLRPVLPRKRLEITHFSPITAWRQLDAGLEENYQNNHFDNSSRIYFWTPEQDLETNHSLDDLRKIDFSSDGYLNNINNRNKNNNHFNKHRAHVFSLSLPRDLTVPSSITTTINNNNNNNKNGLNSLKTFKRSVSDMINNLSFKKGINNINNNNEHHQEDDPNWFLSRSAPNSINGNSFESSDFPFMNNNQISSPRLMYLPDNNNYDFNDDNHCIGSSIYSKSCEDLQDFQPHHNKLMENNKTIIRRTISSKKKKFTFQSTIRQIERRRMAEKLSKEAEQKEKQRLREMEIMKRVEEEFQRKRDKEKANIRHQLRLYAMEEADQYISLPNVELNNLKLEEREEPDGASSPTIPNKIKNLTTTQELSEYRQMQRNYKEYRSCPKFSPEFKPTTVHKEITCKIPNIQERKKYRRDYLSGKIMRRSKSIDSVLTKF